MRVSLGQKSRRSMTIWDYAYAASPADFGELIAEETEKWAKVIRAANIRPE